MEQRTGSLTFPRSDQPGPRTATKTFNFTAPVNQAIAVLTGTEFSFSQPDGDHHLGRVTTVLDIAIDDDVVTVEGAFGVRDWSGDWDDDYEGSLQFLLLAEVLSGVPLSNLSITGVEHTQAIQSFRSQLHLDPATAGPDNGIPLVAGKDTVLRVYVDTGTDPTRPTIGQVNGLLEIRPQGGNWIPISPLNGPVAPIRDSAIRRKDRDATLNFLIPGAFATDRLEIRIRAFDHAVGNRPDLGYASGPVQQTLSFRAVEPLRVRGVLVNYTGTPAVAAPTINDLRSTLSFVEQTYPVGDVVITGVDVIDDNGDYTDMSGSGCGSGWGDLLDKLREMRGGREDIYYGLLPNGVPLGFGGCGGGGVAAGPVGAGSTAAQEIAHAFDRDHAPCGNPGNPDPNYPTYGTLPMGSIGEYGMDASGNVKDPERVTDFMSYCSPNWVSPYTYLALLAQFPTQSPTSRTRAERAPLLSEPVGEHLFLNVRILRGGRIEPLPSFHYETRRLPHRGSRTPYVVELRDRFGRPLISQRVLLGDPHMNVDDAELHVLEQLPMPDGLARVVILCDEDGCTRTTLHSIDVPSEKPRVEILTPSPQEGDTIRVSWKTRESGVSFLVRFSNDDGSTWTTIAPRTSAHSLDVDASLLPSGEACRFQVLATSGIRTAAAVSAPFPLNPRPPVMLMSTPDVTTVTPAEPVLLEAEAFTADSGSAPAHEIVWHSDRDGELGTGRRVRFSSLTVGTHRITATLPGDPAELAAASTYITVAPRPKPDLTRHGEEPGGRHQHSE